MNKRLQAICSLICQGRGVVDVGTDHGYIPVALAQNGYAGKIIASDIRPGPLQAARNSAESAEVEDKIEFLLCDGLDGCEKSVIDTIVIAGMGGDTICGILDRAEWCMTPDYTLILQPMTKAEVVRYWLAYNGYEFLDEVLVKDGGIIYQVIRARIKENTSLSLAELFTGEYARAVKNPLFGEFLDTLISRFETGIKGLESAKDCRPCSLTLKKQICSQLMEMREKTNDKN